MKKPSNGAKKPRTPKQLSVTVSLGVADTTAKDPSTDGLLKAADEALYRAKKNGRNQVSK